MHRITPREFLGELSGTLKRRLERNPSRRRCIAATASTPDGLPKPGADPRSCLPARTVPDRHLVTDGLPLLGDRLDRTTAGRRRSHRGSRGSLSGRTAARDRFIEKTSRSAGSVGKTPPARPGRELRPPGGHRVESSVQWRGSRRGRRDRANGTHRVLNRLELSP